MTNYQKVQETLTSDPKVWLITGVAGFIGSNLLEHLLKLGQKVVGLDNFSTGYQSNLDEVKSNVSDGQWANFRFIEGDIRNLDDCKKGCKDVDFVLHQAALGSVPRSIDDPISTNEVNIAGFLNILVASNDAKVSGFTYAASSASYGDHPALPKVEENIGKPLSPYAVTKLVDELYAGVFALSYGFQSVGLRYFNVFGCRQDPTGSYAAVIPKWVSAAINKEPIFINGDGETSRDFCFVDNVVQANILSAVMQENNVNSGDMLTKGKPNSHIINVAVGEKTSLNELFYKIRSNLVRNYPTLKDIEPVYRDFRVGDVRHSLASISKAEKILGYQPTHSIGDGLKIAIQWYIRSDKSQI